LQYCKSRGNTEGLNQVYKDLICVVAAKGHLSKGETATIIEDLERTANGKKEGMMQQIISYFLETNEFEFFIKRLKNATSTRNMMPQETVKKPKTFAPLCPN